MGTPEDPERIPKIIHQIWIGPNQQPDIWMNSFVDFCKTYGYEYKLWNEDSIEDLPWDSFPGIRDVYTELGGHLAAKSDIFRYLCLYKYGGVYMDADSVVVKPQKFSEFLENNRAKVFFAYEEFQEGKKPKEASVQSIFIDGNKFVAGGVMGSTKGHPLLKHLCEEVVDHYKSFKDEPPWMSVGPAYLTKVYSKYKSSYDGITVYPMKFFYPIHWHNISDPELHTKIELPEESMLFQYGYSTNNFGEIFKRRANTLEGFLGVTSSDLIRFITRAIAWILAGLVLFWAFFRSSFESKTTHAKRKGRKGSRRSSQN
jgi:hypothetical protein